MPGGEMVVIKKERKQRECDIEAREEEWRKVNVVACSFDLGRHLSRNYSKRTFRSTAVPAAPGAQDSCLTVTVLSRCL
jgi:hypothetical protein